MDLLTKLVCSNVRSEILRVLFGFGLPEMHLRELHRHTGLALTGVRRDLEKLKKMDLIAVRRDGNRVYFKANQEHPIFRDINNIVIKTSGLVEVLRNELSKAPEIKVAFIFGSVARNEERAQSDVDLMIIGDIGLRKVSHLLSGIGLRLEREVNPRVFTEREFIKRRREENHFITSVLATRRIFVVGNEHDLEAMV